MRNAHIYQGLIVTVAILIGGCNTWTGPRAKVEDRRAPGAGALAARATPTQKVSQTFSRKPVEKPQREERLASNEPAKPARNTTTDLKELVSQVSRIKADAVSRDEIVEMKP